MRPFIRVLLALSLTLFAAQFDLRAQAVELPRVIKIIVPLPPGGAGDIVARLLAAEISQPNSSIVVENRPGAGSIIGAEAVAHSAPDGATLLINAPYLLIGPQVKKVNFDPLRSFEPVCYLVSSPGVIVVNSSSPYRTLGDFLKAAKEKPGEITFASVGPATAQHLGIEQLKRAANVNLTYVPYPGGAPAINALLGGHITALLAEYAPLSEHIKSGTLRAIATTSRSRIDPLPQLPTVAESGFKDFEVDLWWSIFAPANTPKDVVTELAKKFSAAVRAPAIKTKLAAQGFTPVADCGPNFQALLRKQYDAYSRIIRDANIQTQ